MELCSIIPSGHLYYVNRVLPPHLVDLVNSLPWNQMDYRRLIIGQYRRRKIENHDKNLQDIREYMLDYVVPAVEQYCSVKFTNLDQFSVSWWVDEPGFQPSIHTDGDLPCAMQIYWHPQDRYDLGTVFYHDPTKQKILHEFTSHPNSGYLMFNAHKYHGQQPQLWHDMSQPVPDNVMRLSSYLWLGPYKKY